jgi:hypothetical protein
MLGNSFLEKNSICFAHLVTNTVVAKIGEIEECTNKAKKEITEHTGQSLEENGMV